MRGSGNHLYVRDGSVCLKCTSGGEGHVQHGSGDDYGQHTDGEHTALRHVLVHGKSDSGGGNGGGARRADAHALHSGISGSLGAGKSDGVNRRETGPQ